MKREQKSIPGSGPNLYLAGFMGTGKSVVGRKLADVLNFRFIDADDWIERQQKRKISEIFAEDGEARFRDLERAFIENGHPDSGCVVSCGGGLIVPPGMLERVQARGLLFCLFASPETIYERTRGHRHRPLLETDNPVERIRALLEEREPVYMKAGTLITTDHRSVAEIVAHIKRVYLNAKGEWERARKEGGGE